MNAIVTPAAKTPAIPEPAKKPAATNCDKLSNESLFLRLHDPDKNAPKKTITENLGEENFNAGRGKLGEIDVIGAQLVDL